jgi:hypothetical protein
LAGSRERGRRLAGVAIVVVVAASAAIAPTAIDHVRRADAGSTTAASQPPALEPDDATTAWIDRADAATAAAQTPSSTPPKSVRGTPGVAPAGEANSLLVTFAADVSSSEAEDIVEQAGAEAEPIAGTDTVEVTAAEPELPAVTAELTAEPDVEAVEPNRVRSASRVPNDASYPSQ